MVSVSRGRSSCPVSLGLEYDGSVAYSKRNYEMAHMIWFCKRMFWMLSKRTLKASLAAQPAQKTIFLDASPTATGGIH